MAEALGWLVPPTVFKTAVGQLRCPGQVRFLCASAERASPEKPALATAASSAPASAAAQRRDQCVTNAERAVALLQAVATGDCSRDDAHALARDWLATAGGELALQVLTGGEFEAAKVVQLCERIIELTGLDSAEAVSTAGGER